MTIDQITRCRLLPMRNVRITYTTEYGDGTQDELEMLDWLEADSTYTLQAVMQGAMIAGWKFELTAIIPQDNYQDMAPGLQALAMSRIDRVALELDGTDSDALGAAGVATMDFPLAAPPHMSAVGIRNWSLAGITINKAERRPRLEIKLTGIMDLQAIHGLAFTFFTQQSGW